MQKEYATLTLIISHDMNCVRLIADRVALFVDGRCYAEGPYDEPQQQNDPQNHAFLPLNTPNDTPQCPASNHVRLGLF